ncbi:MATE family efflux transporter [Lachnospiraceae bacterium 29-84]
MRIQLSDHFTYQRLIRFVMPPILMMICTSLYSIVDGFFVSNYVGKTPFAAVNLVMPVCMGFGAIGIMMGTGGSALVSKMLGEGKHKEAKECFSLLVYFTVGLSLVLSLVAVIFAEPISKALGAKGELLVNCVLYIRILSISLPSFVLQNMFQSFCVAAEKPSLSLRVSIVAGITNMILDYLFIVVFHWGLAGAAVATVTGELIGGIVPLAYFIRKNDSLLQLGKTKFRVRTLGRAFGNGSSEMVTQLSVSIVNILYNFQLMRFAGENGVAAYGIVMYVNFVFMAINFGYAIGSSPVVSFHYGAGNHKELKNLLQKSITLMAACGIGLTFMAEALNVPLVSMFASYDEELLAMTCRGFRSYALAFCVMGLNVWGSAFFTALGNGAVSAVISFLRTLVFQVVMVFLLPYFWGIDGIWLAIVAAEFLALCCTVGFLLRNRKRYHYA